MYSKGSFYKIIKILPIITVFILSLFFLVLTTTLNHSVVYDEANTLNIAQLNTEELLLILNNEQNIPGYYLVISFLSKVFSSNLVIYTFNWVIYLLNLFVLYKILNNYFKSIDSIYYTSLFSFLTGVSMYAFFIRMYGVVVLLVLLIIYYLTTKKPLENKQYSLFIVAILLLLLSTIHPQFIFVYLLVLLQIKRNSFDNSNIRRTFFVLFLLPLILFLYLMFLKTDISRIYLGEGISYVVNQKDIYLNFLHSLFFRYENSYSTVFSLFIIAFVIKFFVKYHKKKEELIYILSIFLFFVIPIFGTFKDTSMHYIFLVPFIYIIFVRSFDNFVTKRFIQYKSRIMLLLFLVFLNFSLHSLLVYFETEVNVKREICNEVHTNGDGIYITRFYIYEMLSQCLSENSRIIIATKDKFFDISTMSNLDKLYTQALLGGHYYSQSEIEIKAIVSYINDIYPNEPIYYVPDYDSRTYMNHHSITNFLTDQNKSGFIYYIN